MRLLQQGLIFGLAAFLQFDLGYAVQPAPATDPELFGDMVQRGCRLMNEGLNPDLGQEYVKQYTIPELQKAGWIRTQDDAVMSTAARNQLSNLAGWEGPVFGITRPYAIQDFRNDDTLQNFHWEHVQDGVKYQFALSKKSKMIIVREQTMPDDRLSEQRLQPDVAHLSDLMHAEWCRAISVSPDKENSSGKTTPMYFLLDVVNRPQESMDVLHFCLHSLGLDQAPAWPDAATFAFGTDCFNALLGTKNAESIAWFFISHRSHWKLWMLSSVAIFRYGADDYPSMMWTSARTDDRYHDKLAENIRAQEQYHETGVQGSFVPPNKMVGTMHLEIESGQGAPAA